MAELTLEQKRALALARARQAQAQAQQAAPTSEPSPEAAPDRSLGHRIYDNLIGSDDGVMSFGEKLATALNMGGESMTMGLVGDEANAAVRSLGGGTYDENLAKYRADEAQLQKESPGVALGAQIGGALAPVGAVGLGLRGAGMGARALYSGLAGLGQGATYGFMEGEGAEGRVRDAVVNGLIGGTLGAAMPPVISGIGKAASPVTNSVMSALGYGNANRASRAIGDMVERSGQSSDDLMSAIRQAGAEGQPEYVLADALGHSGQRGLAGIARRPGPGRTEIADALSRRQEGQADRLAGYLEDSYGFRGNPRPAQGTALVPEGHTFRDAPSDVLSRPQRSARQTTEALTSARGKAADEAFDAARQGAGPVDVRGALAAIDRRLAPMQAGEGVTGGPIDAKLAGFRKRLAGDGTELSDFDRVIDVKKDVQDAVGEAVRAGRNNEARLLGQVQRELDGALEQASGGYRAANDDFARASRVIDAVDEGAEMARPGARAVDTTGRFQRMSPDQKAAARVGYGDRQLAKVEGAAGPFTNRARPFTSEKARQEMGSLALDPDRLGRRIDRENVMFDTYRQALGGSQTADNLADAAESSGYDASAIVNLLTGNFGTGARQLLQAAGHAIRGQNEETRQIIARALLSRDPGSVLAQAAQQTRSDATRKAIVDALAIASGQKVGHFISQNP